MRTKLSFIEVITPALNVLPVWGAGLVIPLDNVGQSYHDECVSNAPPLSVTN